MVTPVSTILSPEELLPPSYPHKEKPLPPGNGEETVKPGKHFEIPAEEPPQKPENPSGTPETQEDNTKLRNEEKSPIKDETADATRLHTLPSEQITSLTEEFDKIEEEFITGIEKETQEKLPNAT